MSEILAQAMSEQDKTNTGQVSAWQISGPRADRLGECVAKLSPASLIEATEIIKRLHLFCVFIFEDNSTLHA